jgi:hypothetical protein
MNLQITPDRGDLMHAYSAQNLNLSSSKIKDGIEWKSSPDSTSSEEPVMLVTLTVASATLKSKTKKQREINRK